VRPISWSNNKLEPQLTAILIPSLNRPKNLERVLLNIRYTTPEPHRTYVMISKDDIDSQRICRGHSAIFWTDSDSDLQYFVPRIQALFEKTSEPWIFTGSDDIVYPYGWLTNCFSVADSGTKIICPNDGHNPKGTNFLVDREYIMTEGGNWDTPGYVYHPSYRHNRSDDEMVNVALYRKIYTRAMDVLIESTHPSWGNAPNDSTYERVALVSAADEALFQSRAPLWGGQDLWR